MPVNDIRQTGRKARILATAQQVTGLVGAVCGISASLDQKLSHSHSRCLGTAGPLLIAFT